MADYCRLRIVPLSEGCRTCVLSSIYGDGAYQSVIAKIQLDFRAEGNVMIMVIQIGLYANDLLQFL